MTMDTFSSRVNGSVFHEKEVEMNGTSVVSELQTKKRKNENQLELFDDQDALFAGKSHRACKGKRYEQFMSVMPSKKATKQKSTNSVTSTSDQLPYIGHCKPQEAVTVNQKQDESSDDLSHIATSPETDETEQRNGDAVDFKLNEKIMTLPSLDLDDYLNQKKAMKKKKKFNRRR